MHGPNMQDIICTLGTQCLVTLSGAGLASTNGCMIVPIIDLCGNDWSSSAQDRVSTTYTLTGLTASQFSTIQAAFMRCLAITINVKERRLTIAKIEEEAGPQVKIFIGVVASTGSGSTTVDTLSGYTAEASHDGTICSGADTLSTLSTATSVYDCAQECGTHSTCAYFQLDTSQHCVTCSSVPNVASAGATGYREYLYEHSKAAEGRPGVVTLVYWWSWWWKGLYTSR